MLKHPAYQTVVKAKNLPTEMLGSILDEIIEKMGLILIEEATPDYIGYELRARNNR